MSNFPSKWYDFINHKELKKLRTDINNTLSLRIEIAVSIVLAIISFFLGKQLTEAAFGAQIIVCIIMCIVVILLFSFPYICNWISMRKRYNIFINGKEATNIFDDEIVYDILVATEYYNSKSQIPENDLKEELETFYTIEIKYYVSNSVEKLTYFTSNFWCIFGNKKNQITFERVSNVIKLIDKLIKMENLQLDDSLKKRYDIFCGELGKNL